MMPLLCIVDAHLDRIVHARLVNVELEFSLLPKTSEPRSLSELRAGDFVKIQCFVRARNYF